MEANIIIKSKYLDSCPFLRQTDSFHRSKVDFCQKNILTFNSTQTFTFQPQIVTISIKFVIICLA